MIDDKQQVDWLAKAREVLDIEVRGLTAVRDRLDESFVTALKLMASCAGRVVVTGLGKSGLVGRKIAATLSSTGTPAFFLHPVEGAHGDLGMIRSEDVIVAISNSGETDELN
ncbi:MAG: SIS domain-containing protein, partial [Desulfomicrobium sp.]|nr:SIS domain-containing protein [Desulfomicrobium sp.]